MAKVPEIKKKVSSYLLNEDGKISKQSLVAIGSLVTGAAISLMSRDAAAHSNYVSHDANSLSVRYAPTDATVTGNHGHHSSHHSHSSHSSHSSHGSGGY